MTTIDDLPPLREVIRRHGLPAKKSLGQNFLLDLNLTARIARAAGPLEGVTVLEVGPGPGGLTRALLAANARRVIAVERDPRAIAALAEIAERYPGRLAVIEADALDFDPQPLLDHGATRVVANLPYNVATALLVRWLSIEPWPPWYDNLVLMFQREVAERIVARSGRKQLRPLVGVGQLALCHQTSVRHPTVGVCAAAQGYLVAGASRPATRSATMRRLNALERVTAAAFGQRRKMLRQSLKALAPDPSPLLAAAGLDPTARAQDVTVEGFAALARVLAREQ